MISIQGSKSSVSATTCEEKERERGKKEEEEETGCKTNQCSLPLSSILSSVQYSFFYTFLRKVKKERFFRILDFRFGCLNVRRLTFSFPFLNPPPTLLISHAFFISYFLSHSLHGWFCLPKIVCLDLILQSQKVSPEAIKVRHP